MLFGETLEACAGAYVMVQFAREGIPPSEYKQLTLRERQSIRGILSGETEALGVKRGQ